MKKMFLEVSEFSRKLAQGAKNVVQKTAAPAVGAGALTLAGNALAAAPDYSAITGAADWSTVATAIITVLAAVALVLVAFSGGKMLLKALRGH